MLFHTKKGRSFNSQLRGNKLKKAYVAGNWQDKFLQYRATLILPCAKIFGLYKRCQKEAQTQGKLR